MSPPLDSIHASRVDLERFRFVAAEYMTDLMLEEAVSVEVIRDEVMQRLAYRLRYTVFGQRLDEQVVQYPSNWWQAFRERWFPMWARRRWPIQYARVHMRLQALYPQIPPDQRPVYHIEIDPSESGPFWGEGKTNDGIVPDGAL